MNEVVLYALTPDTHLNCKPYEHIFSLKQMLRKPIFTNQMLDKVAALCPFRSPNPTLHQSLPEVDITNLYEQGSGLCS